MVPGGSVVVEKVSEVVTETDHVATNVSVRSGRIVAEQLQTFQGREGRPKGLTATVGATTPAAVWTFPVSAPADVESAVGGRVRPGRHRHRRDRRGAARRSRRHGTVEPFKVTVPAHRASPST